MSEESYLSYTCGCGVEVTIHLIIVTEIYRDLHPELVTREKEKLHS